MLLLLLAFSTCISAIALDICASFNTAETPLSELGGGIENEANNLTLSQMSAYGNRTVLAEASAQRRIMPSPSRSRIHAGAPTTSLTRLRPSTSRNATLLAPGGTKRIAVALAYSAISS